MSMREVLRELQAVYQVNDTELARETGIPQATIYRLVSGMTDDPKLSSLKPLAQFFNVSIGQLTGDEPLPPLNDQQALSQKKWHYKVPIITWEQASEWETVVGKLSHQNWGEWCASNFPLSTAAYALSIEKNKFYKPWDKPAVAVIEPNLDPTTGDLVAIYLSSNRSVSLKHWIVEDEIIWLTSLNKGVPAVRWTENFKYCGVVIQVYLQMKERIF